MLRHNNKLLAKSGTVKLRPVADLPEWAKDMQLNMRMVCETDINATAGRTLLHVEAQSYLPEATQS